MLEDTEDRQRQFDSFEAACHAAFPNVKWRFRFSTGTINTIAAAMLIDRPYMELKVELFYSGGGDRQSACASVFVERSEVFRSTREKGQSPEDALKLSKSFISEFVNTLAKVSA